MMRLLRFLWTGDFHLHLWEQTDEGLILRGARTAGRFKISRCKTCGCYKRWNLLA